MASCAVAFKPNVCQRVVDRRPAQHTTILIEASESRPRTYDLQAIASADRQGSQVRDAILFKCSRENFRWRLLLMARSGHARLSGLTVLRCAILRDPRNSTIRYLPEMAAWRRDFASIQIGCARRSTNGSTLVEWGRESECRFKSGKTVRNDSNNSSAGTRGAEPNSANDWGVAAVIAEQLRPLTPAWTRCGEKGKQAQYPHSAAGVSGRVKAQNPRLLAGSVLRSPPESSGARPALLRRQRLRDAESPRNRPKARRGHWAQ